MRNDTWFTGTDIDAFTPATYDLADVEIADFVEEFKLSKAEAIIKAFIKKKKTLEDIGLGKLVIAMIVSKRRLLTIRELIEESAVGISMITEEEWEILTCLKTQEAKIYAKYPRTKKRIDKIMSALHKKYKIEANGEVLRLETKSILSRMKKRFPQFYLNNSQNVWIAKPASSSRGRGIIMCTDLTRILGHMTSRHYIIQRYIEIPLIILNRKFDIRQWVLVTSFNPLVIYMFDEMYVRFGAEDYNTDTVWNKFAHLTNNSITKHCVSDSKIKGNMWSQSEFIKYIDATFGKGRWKKIRNKFKTIIKTSLISGSEYIMQRKNSFEILGYDFMIDQKLNPWLIEVNASPAIDYSTEITERYIKMAISDALKVIIELPQVPPEKRKDFDTGKFKLIHQGSVFPQRGQLSLAFSHRAITF